MEVFNITGNLPLFGNVRVHGAKNAALPILAASLMAPSETIIEDVPRLLDIQVMNDILQALGVQVVHQGQRVTINPQTLSSTRIPNELMGKMRSSIFLMGPLLAKYGQVTISKPGGCAIGERPIDLHVEGLQALGATIQEKDELMICQASQLRGNTLQLRYPSVGATENLMMAAVLAEGQTVIKNAAREPEIVDLQNFLVEMGGRVKGAGTSQIVIEGVQELRPVHYKVIPDRIIAGTLVLAAAITKGDVQLSNVRADHLQALLSYLKVCGVDIQIDHDIMRVKARKAPTTVKSIITGPYPAFPTDLQAQMMAYLSIASGTNMIKETVFEGRLKHVDELNRMGADILIDLDTAFIRGVPQLYGATVEASDLRAGAALILAGLQATGTTTIKEIHHIDRGYEQIEQMVTSLGGHMKRVQVEV